MTKEYILSNAIFNHFHSDNDGGSISVSNVSIQIYCCSFFDSSCANYGGSINCANSSIKLEKTSFSNCYSTASNDDIYGNAAYFLQTNVSIKNIETHLCSPTSEDKKCGDSSLASTKCLNVISMLNASANHGYSGSSGFSFNDIQEGSSAKYMNIISGYDNFMIESRYAQMTVEFTNIIDCKNVKYSVIYVQQDNELVFISCVFMDIGDKTFSYSGRKYSAENCFSDIDISSISQTDSVKTFDIVPNLQCLIHSMNYHSIISRSFFIQISSILFVLNFS